MRFIKEACEVETTESLGVIVVGCGYWGRHYVRVFRELTGAHVVAVCDASMAQLEQVGAAYPGIDLTTDLDEALEMPGAHAAVICTPASTHRDVAERCLARGMHLLVEKPMTTTSEDATRLLDLSASAGATLMAGHTFVFNAGVRKLKEYADDDASGATYYLYSRRTSLGPIRRDVNAIWDLAPHDISIFNYLLGMTPERVSAVGSRLLGQDREDVGFVTLTYPNGILAFSHVSWADPNKTREVVLVSSAKRVVFDDLKPLEPVRVYEKGVTVAPENPTFGEFAFLLRDGDILSPLIEGSEPLKNQCAHFLECVRHRTRPISDGRAGRDVVLAMEAIDQSLAEGGRPVAVHALADDGKNVDDTLASAVR